MTIPLAAIVGLSGPELTPAEADLLRAHAPLGVILFRRNIVSSAQLGRLVAAVRAVLPENGLLMVDQEGGRVARLRPPQWLAHPPAAWIGRLHERDPATGVRAAWLTGALIGADCLKAGFDVVAAPVLDRHVPWAHDVIGDRAFGSDPRAIAILGRAIACGLLAAGVQPVAKHVPGHGRAVSDSHVAMPELDRIEPDDLEPFRLLAWLPWMMTAHIRFREEDPHNAATLSRAILQGVVRQRLGFDNLLMSDDLAMQALSGPAGARAAAALEAGCDIALHCSGVFEETADVLDRVRPLDAPALHRLAAARATVAQHRRPLDMRVLVAEREGLLC
ncbi:beta-N-acetylhexosaminidase [Lichenicoccus sp.]|uniref:beta-N-acetylhexosaminidase n=1 Tax=Lichenicoccus sp. TaxID=2781899 RepID=UPI003D105DFF